MPRGGNMQPVLREWSGSSLRDRIELIWMQIYKSIRDPITRVFMAQFIRECPERDDMCDLRAIFDGYKSNFRYTPDIRDLDTFLTLRRQWLLGGGNPDGDISKGGLFLGDCDDATIGICSLCLHANFRVGAKVISPNGKEFVHIYPLVEFPRNPKRGLAGTDEGPRRVFMDATVRSSTLGWEPPKTYRKAERVFWYSEKH
jgi:hypothetical protein